MARKSLIIVESPGKIKTIQKILGDKFQVKASVGHIMNLPKNRLGVDVDGGFEPEYTVIFGKKKIIDELKAASIKADKIYLAPDPDREGETIAWNLAKSLDIPEQDECRVTFNAITDEEVKRGLDNPRTIDFGKVKSQQSRRVLDRLVGYQLSPLLWKKLKWGLSAGRVQSVALLLVVEKEKEVSAFNIEEYWVINGFFPLPKGGQLKAKLITIGDIKENSFAIRDEQTAEKAVKGIEKSKFTIIKKELKKQKKQPSPPFITSTLQQEASRRFGMSPQRTMSVAQKLYEGISVGKEGQIGLITYMRTDSVRVAPGACEDAIKTAGKIYGSQFVSPKIRNYSRKGKAQDAHEAIRPTRVDLIPSDLSSSLTKEQFKLYELIWHRFIASQMKDAIYEQFIIDLGGGEENYRLRASGSRLDFPGFMAIGLEDEEEEVKLPPVEMGMELMPKQVEAEQKFTQPPPRYNEATLIRALEKQGIGRPSTYAVIVETILDRDYVFKEDKKIRPTDLGIVANAKLRQFFQDIIDVDFTAKMEEQLDRIEDGSEEYHRVLQGFYQQFSKVLEIAEEKMEGSNIETDYICSSCNKAMSLKFGKTGEYLACSDYPKCKKTVNIPNGINILPVDWQPGEKAIISQNMEKVSEFLKNSKANEKIEGACELCGGDLIQRDGRYGPFISCANYPKCKFTKKINKSTGIACPLPDCGGTIIEKRTKTGRVFYGCDKYPACEYTLWRKPTGNKCEKCNLLLVEYQSKKGITEKCPKCDIPARKTKAK